MKIKVKYILIAWVVIVLLILWGMTSDASLDSRVSSIMHGGAVSTKSHSLWELHRYKDTVLLRKSPCRWCPYKAYCVCVKYVEVYANDNRNWIAIRADLFDLLSDDANFNRQFAQRFRVRGSRKRQVYTIYKWCGATKYIAHVKYARNVFETRTGDCAAIASAFYVLCKAKQIPVRYVIGWTSGKNGGCHAWNRVKVNGRWYWIDATQHEWLSREQYDGRKVMEMW